MRLFIISCLFSLLFTFFFGCKSLKIPDENRAQQISIFLLEDYLSESLKFMEEGERRAFKFYQVDLNGDRKKEVLVYLASPYFCGSGGCNLLVLSDQNELITEMTVFKPPLFVQKQKKDWAVLWAKYRGKAIPLVFKDGSYPPNRTVIASDTDKVPSDAEEVLFDTLKFYNF